MPLYANSSSANQLVSQERCLYMLIDSSSLQVFQTATLVDNIFTTQPSTFISSILISVISDHLPLLILIQNLLTKKFSEQNTNLSWPVICLNKTPICLGLSWPGSALSWPVSALSWPGSTLSWPGSTLSWPGSALSWPGSALSWPASA